MAITLTVTAAYFLHILSFYFLAKWLPELLVRCSRSRCSECYAGTGPRVPGTHQLGGAAGGALFGLLAARIGLKPLTIAILVCNAVAIVVFAGHPHDLNTLTWIAITVGFFGNASHLWHVLSCRLRISHPCPGYRHGFRHWYGTHRCILIATADGLPVRWRNDLHSP
jgi:hypothetical protein